MCLVEHQAQVTKEVGLVKDTLKEKEKEIIYMSILMVEREEVTKSL